MNLMNRRMAFIYEIFLGLGFTFPFENIYRLEFWFWRGRITSSGRATLAHASLPVGSVIILPDIN